jgi:hypothetical protein
MDKYEPYWTNMRLIGQAFGREGHVGRTDAQNTLDVSCSRLKVVEAKMLF